MVDVFISYKSERRPAADHLASILRHHGYSVWVDYEGLKPGEGYAARLEAKVKEAQVVLVLWCQLAVQSQWVAKEAGWAKERQSYIPLWLEEATLPAAFKDDHTLALAHWNGGPMDGALAPLLRAIGERIGRPPQQDFAAMSREQQTWERYGRPSLARFALDPPAKGREEAAAPSRPAESPLRATPRPPAQLVLQHAAELRDAAWSPDGTRIVTAGKTAKVWDSQSGRELRTLKGHRALLSSAAFSPDGTRIVTASHDGTAKLWDSQSGRELRTLKGHRALLSSAAFSPDGTQIVTASHDGTAKLWDFRSGSEISILQGHQTTVRSAAFSPDGTRIVTASDDGTANVWDSQSGRELLSLQIQQRGVTSAAFSPDGTRIVTAGKTAKVWDSQSGRNLLALQGHIDHVDRAAFSPDGTRIVTVGDGVMVMQCDSQTGRYLRTVQSHQGLVRTAAFSPDGTRIVTASGDGTANVWEAG